MPGNQLKAVLECGCCGNAPGNCICNRPLGPRLTMRFASANLPSVYHEIELTYGLIDEPDIICLPFSPEPFPGYSGSFSGVLALPMGGSRFDTIDIRVMCECTNCDLCVYYRFGSTSPTWCVTFARALTCVCPAIIEVDDFAGPCDAWSYQIFDIVMLEPMENCE